MKLSIRNIKNERHTLEVDESTTVASIKERIESELSLGEASKSKLIFSGKILKDDQTVAAAGLKEGDAVVVMFSAHATKPRPGASTTSTAAAPAATAATASAASTVAPAASASASSSSSSSSSSATTRFPASPAPASSGSSAASGSVPPPVTPAVSVAANAPSVAAERAARVASQREAAAAGPARPARPARRAQPVFEHDPTVVANLTSLGFPEDQVRAALTAAFGSPDRAAEYLFNGIPANAPAAGGAGGAGGAGMDAGDGEDDGEDDDGEDDDDDMDDGDEDGADDSLGLDEPAEVDVEMMENNEEIAAGAEELTGRIERLRSIIMARPELLPQILNEISNANPQLGAMIRANPEAVMQMLTQGAADIRTAALANVNAARGGGGAGGAAGAPGAPGAAAQPAVQRIALSPAEQASVQNLIGLGFTPRRALEAFLICDRNEEMAANYLFENPEERN
jgi:UV excision repair protein RAD23